MNTLALLLTLATASPSADAAAAPAAPPDTTRWTVIMGERHAGSLKHWTDARGELRYTFEYNDRGRGPKMETHLRLGPGGVPVLVETTGVDYYKNPISERFTLENGTARWTNSTERGEKAVSGAAMYVGMYDASDPGVQTRALLAAPGHTLPLLPEGSAKAERVRDLQVSANGQTRTVTLYRVSGFGFEPAPLWLNPDGRYFATASGWISTVEAGWESALPALLKAQDEADAERARELARTLARRPDRPLAFRNVSLFDPQTKTTRPGTTVVVTGNRISAVGPDASTAVPAGAEVIDGRGKTLLPGLWDMHVHVGPLDGLMHLAAGVTTVRDLGNDTAVVVDLRRKWEAGEALGPRVIAAGFLDGPGPFTGPTGLKVSTPEQVRAAIDAYRRMGMEQIKVYSSLDTLLLPVAIEHGHRSGMRVSGHIPWPLTAERAVRLGIDELQHANFLLLNFLGDTIDTRTPARFTAVARMAADLDLNAERVQAFARLLRERDVVVDPTLATFEGMITARLGEVSPGFVTVADRLPPNVRRYLRTGGLPVPEGMDQRYRDSYRKMMEIVALLHRSGVQIVPGTDDVAGFQLHRELELYVQAGIPAADALYMATLGSARVMKRDDRLGVVAPGRLADLVLVAGDPARNISDIRRTALVVKDGVVYDPDALYAAIGVSPVPAAW